MITKYSKNFFEGQKNGSIRSALEIVPVINKIFNPKSIVDIGCGVGTWLKVFEENGISDIAGIDGNYIKKEQLVIPISKFTSHDLETPIQNGRVYDFAISLEVGEHLPAGSAQQLVKTICSLAPVALFSAAVPFQGGTHHVNEQWQSYWADLFIKQDFLVVQGFRNIIWDNASIEPWYKQNIQLFINKNSADIYKNILESNNLSISNSSTALNVIHPEIYIKAVKSDQMLYPQIKRAIFALPYLLKRNIKRLF